MVDKEKTEKKEEPSCDPLVEECDAVRSSVLEKTEESAILAHGIKRMESAMKELDEAAKVFEDESGEDAFKDEKEKLREKLEEAKKMKDQCDGDCFQGIKKFNICKKSEPKKER
jgi:hypothetical protein